MRTNYPISIRAAMTCFCGVRPSTEAITRCCHCPDQDCRDNNQTNQQLSHDTSYMAGTQGFEPRLSSFRDLRATVTLHPNVVAR